MEKEKDNVLKSIGFYFLGLFGILTIVAGLALVSMKFFGFPYLIEGFIYIVSGIIMFSLSKLYDLYLDTISIYSEMLTTVVNTKTLENSKNMPMTGGTEIAPVMQFVIDEDTPPEALDAIKKQFPFLSSMLDSTKEKNAKNYNSMTMKELEKELGKVIKDEDFETAAIIKGLIKTKES